MLDVPLAAGAHALLPRGNRPLGVFGVQGPDWLLDPTWVKPALIVLSAWGAGGATVLSHVNDSGFWLVSRFFEMDEKTTLKTWTVMETTLGVSIFVLALGIWAVG